MGLGNGLINLEALGHDLMSSMHIGPSNLVAMGPNYHKVMGLKNYATMGSTLVVQQ
jgi:hypothetical protein